MSEDILLEIHRDFTDKEKIDWLTNDCRKLRMQLQNLTNQNNNLNKINAALTKRIKDDEDLSPSEINKEKFVKAKTHNKLLKRYKEMDKRFWEMVHEIKEEKL